MKLFVTGANGMLGQHLIRQLAEEGKFQLHITGKGTNRVSYGKTSNVTYHALDLTDFKKVQALVEKVQPHIIIHAGASTQPNDCANDPAQCWKVNVGATRSLLRAAQKTKSYFIYVSTDFVFDGQDGPYDETAIPNPVNHYGESKLLAEEMVEMSGLHWAIARTVLVYGNKVPGGRSNFVLWVDDHLKKGLPIKVVDDQVRTPTYVEDLSKGIILMMLKHVKGIYHISGKDTCTPYELALKIASLRGYDSGLITRVTSDTFIEPAKRPLKTGFIIHKAVRELGYVPLALEEGLREVLTRHHNTD